jgi:hypothetical protein
MNASEQKDQKILAYLDNMLSESERKNFEQMMESDPALRQKMEHVLELNRMIKAEKLQVPSRNFTRNVMENLHHYPLSSKPVILNSVLLLAGVITLIGLCTAMVYFGLFDTQANVNLNTVDIVNKYIHKSLPQINLDGKVIVNTVIFLNLILALIVLDKAVLKPVFMRRMETEA